MNYRIPVAVGLVFLYLMPGPVNSAEMDQIFDYEIAKLEARIKLLDRALRLKRMSKETGRRTRVELSLLDGQLSNIKSVKKSSDGSVQVQHANSIATKYISLYSYAVEFRKDYGTRRDLTDVEIESLKAELAKFEKWRKKLKSPNKAVDGDKK